MNLPTFKRRAVLLCWCVSILAGCGGGAALVASGVGSGGTGITLGTLLGLGSVIVDGHRIDDSQAQILVESQPGNLASVPLGANAPLLGQQIEVTSDLTGSTATLVRVIPTVIGEVDSLNASSNTLIVAGQSIFLNSDPTRGAPTVLDGLGALTDISVGDRVEVHGFATTNGPGGAAGLLATRIAALPAGSGPVRITGAISNLDPTAHTFQIGALQLTYGSTVQFQPANATLANGQTVVVWSSQAVIAGTLQAEVIAPVTHNQGGQTLRIGGIVSNCSSAGSCSSSFIVNGIPVNASGANYVVGSAASLANGVFVRLAGKADSSSGILNAATVDFRPATEADVTLYGTLANYLSDLSFSVRGVPLTTDGNTTRSPGCVLANNQPVQITGAVHSNLVLSQTITCLTSIEGLTVNLTGVVSGLNNGSQTFRVNGLLGGTPVFFGQASMALGISTAVANGMYVDVQGVVRQGVIQAQTVTIDSAPIGAQFDVQGLAYAVASTHFRVNGLLIQYASGVVSGGNLVKGAKTKVRFTDTGGGNYQAISIKIIP